MIRAGSVVRLKKEFAKKYKHGEILSNNDFIVIGYKDDNDILLVNKELNAKTILPEDELDIICDVSEDEGEEQIIECHEERAEKFMDDQLEKLKKSISFLGGRPERDTVINSDDIINLNIAVNTCKTFEQFFELV